MSLWTSASMSSFLEIFLYLSLFTSLLVSLIHALVIILSLKSYPISMRILPLPFMTLIISIIWSLGHILALALIIGGIYLGIGREMTVYELTAFVFVLGTGVLW
eukprot:CAMPEP_0117442256 /NCGR_PEP_ID=MMETSP0759-20121206/4057_1 /TAXON_ID=63605 /ORGANISM="Percolomonas cosmopolitus, Strain WS" /LENGTH=103 /DNA_ID=CAMNT_0005234137 /DNA_START=106 /DNA_END=414 /DNA_ORIENTATION=+